ncbi:unnamed protein product, partial [Rotaria sp. Silwood2]
MVNICKVFLDILALCCRNTKPLCENILSTGDDVAGTANTFFTSSIFEKKLLRFGVNLGVVIVVDCSSSVALTSRVVVEQSLLHNANV